MFRSLSSILTAAKTKPGLRIFTTLALLLFLAAKAFPADVTLAWDANTESHLGGYKLHWGQGSGNYPQSQDVGNVTTHKVTGLQDESTYYFVVTAYDTTRTINSPYSNEVSYTAPPALHAAFTATPTSGEAPLVVTFSDASTGNVTSWSWDFGDGTTATGKTTVKTYTDPGVYTVQLTVSDASSSDAVTKSDLITVIAPPPVADFSATPTSGSTPLTVQFTDASDGEITNWSWNFGDGSSSTEQNPSHTYTSAGTYTVALTVTGPGGSNTRTLGDYITATDDGSTTPSTAPKLEVGEIGIDNHWYRVPFSQSFVEPVVIAKPLSSNGPDPALVRIRNVDATGFDIRVQEWEYRDGFHALEAVGYLVMERGSYVLEDGSRLEAGRFESNSTSSFQTVKFGQAFQANPVVLSSVSSFNGSQAVTTRLRNITTTSMQFRMQEEEANDQSHATEVISYLAWEPSAGTLDGLRFAVNRTGNVVGDQLYTIEFPAAFADIPMFLADLQTADGGDTATLRWRNMDLSGVDVYVEEEQSKDSETAHTTEDVGYMLFLPQQP
jgi:PKD repeat protein